MTTSSRVPGLLWFIVAVLSLVVALVGVAAPSVYGGLISDVIAPGVFAQDMVAIAASLFLLFLSFKNRTFELRRNVLASGLLVFFFYAYGVYAIERIYNWLYPLYLAILGLSLFTLIHTVADTSRKASDLRVRASVRHIGAACSLFVAVAFTGIWLSQLVPLIQAGDRIEYTYAIYILDIAFIMPAFVIAAIMSLRQRPLGLAAVPSLFVAGAGILSPLALAEILKPLSYGAAMDMGTFWLFLVLSLAFLVLAVVYLRALRHTADPA